jgi:Flp pilus assembly protein CpaB
MKSKSIILIAVSLGFGLVAAIGMSQVMGRNRNSGGPKVEKVQVVYTKTDLQIGEEITAEKVQLKSIDKSLVGEGWVLSMDDVKDQVANATMIKDQPLLKPSITSKTTFLSRNIPTGYEIFAIKANNEITFFGMLKPGDYVDISGVFKHPNTQDPLSLTFLKSIKVYGIDNQDTRDPNAPGGGKQNIIKVLVRPRQKQMLTLAQSISGGKINLSLKNQEEAKEELEKYDVEHKGEDESAVVTSDDLFAAGGLTGTGTASQAPTPAAIQQIFKDLTSSPVSKTNAPAEKKPFKMQIVSGADFEHWTIKDGELPTREVLSNAGTASTSDSASTVSTTGLPVGTMVDSPAEAEDVGADADQSDFDDSSGSDEDSENSSGEKNPESA